MSSNGSQSPSAPDVPPAHRAPRWRSRRVLVPSGIAAVAVVGVGLVPALAASSTPSLPKLTAQQLITKVLESKHQTVSGTVQVSSDLGVPSQLLGQIPTSGKGAGTGTDPRAELTSLLSGTHTLQVAADGQAQQEKLVAQDLPGGQLVLVRNGSSAWVYDGHSNTATHLTGLADHRVAPQDDSFGPLAASPQDAAAQALKQLGPSTDVSVAGASRVAGRNAYELVLSPKGSGSTIGEVRIAIDSATFMPLQVQADPADGGDPIVNVRFTTVDFGKPAAAAFNWAPPSGAKVVQRAAGQGQEQFKPHMGLRPGHGGMPNGAPNGMPHGMQQTVLGSGWQTVYKFTPQSAQKGQLNAVKSFGKSVPGGTLISTRVLNVLVADNGSVYAGAVTPTVLEHDAGH